jgi:hypothetical protein
LWTQSNLGLQIIELAEIVSEYISEKFNHLWVEAWNDTQIRINDGLKPYDWDDEDSSLRSISTQSTLCVIYASHPNTIYWRFRAENWNWNCIRVDINIPTYFDTLSRAIEGCYNGS